MASLGRNYQRLWTASALSNLADGVFQVALPLLAYQINESPGEVAAVAFAGRLPWLLFALPAGALADRLDRRRTMIRVDLGRVVVLAGLAAFVAAGLESIALLCVVSLVLGIGETLFDTSAQSVMPAIVDRDDLTRANGRLYAVELTMNQFVGPPIGGVLAAAAVAAAFAGTAACYALAGLALALMSGSFRPERTGPTTRLRTDIAEGARYLYRHRLLRTLAFMTGVMNLGNMAVFAILPAYVVDPGPMGLSEAGYGLLLTGFALGSLVGSFAADRIERAIGRSGVLMLTVVSGGVFGALPAVTSSVVPVAASFAVIGLTGVAWNVVTVSLRQRIVPDHLLGRVNAGYRLLAWGSMPIGAAIGGVLGELVGIRSVFWFAGITCGLLVLCQPLVTNVAIIAAEEGAGDGDGSDTEKVTTSS